MLVAGLLNQEQLSAIFLNVEELIENNQVLSEKLRDALEIAIEQGDEVSILDLINQILIILILLFCTALTKLCVAECNVP